MPCAFKTAHESRNQSQISDEFSNSALKLQAVVSEIEHHHCCKCVIVFGIKGDGTLVFNCSAASEYAQNAADHDQNHQRRENAGDP